MLTWTRFNATVETILERIDDTIERYLALKLAMGLWIAIAVPVFLVWMISQKNVVTTFDLRFIIAGDILLFALWVALTVYFHIRNRRELAQVERDEQASIEAWQQRTGDEYFCGLHGWVPMSHFPCSGLRKD